ncbi:MAG TPA: glutamate formimidoyltransferase [Candidatus Saccharimonadales bacterium]|nr:glutamate formimidoyltransferase [Candidatus Saccharimonadales bacterium]
MALIECVPNFSEGRDKSRVDAIVNSMKRDGVYLLDYEMDADHNRSVVTLVGEREPLMAAVLAGIGKATELIDLNVQRGAHPRLGATDVVPFIPIEGATLEDCVQMARELGQQVWQRYRVPVYLYEAAATRAERVNLENIRRGQFEVIREEILTLESRRPDVGDPCCHATAGAVVIGARKFLVAYNVYLQTKDVEIAKKIAKAVRFSSGGFRAVKGMGVEVRGQAQVSMNLTDTDLTPMARVFEFVKREAARYGVAVQSSEIVGLVPKRALENAAEWFLQVENFDSSLILENRLAAVISGKAAVGGLRAGVEPFIEQLAAPTAVPGGGSASAAAGAMAAGLVTMVAGMSRGKKPYAQFDGELTVALARLEVLREELKAAIDADAASYEAVMLAYKTQKQASPEQSQASGESVTAALRGACSVPLRAAECAAEVDALATALRAKTNPRMASDLTVASALARAAIEGALANVEINLDSFEAGMETEFLAEARARVAALRNRGTHQP